MGWLALSDSTMRARVVSSYAARRCGIFGGGAGGAEGDAEGDAEDAEDAEDAGDDTAGEGDESAGDGEDEFAAEAPGGSAIYSIEVDENFVQSGYE